MSEITLDDGSVMNLHLARRCFDNLLKLTVRYTEAMEHMLLNMRDCSLLNQTSSSQFGIAILNQIWDKQPKDFMLMVAEMERMSIIKGFKRIVYTTGPYIQQCRDEMLEHYSYEVDRKYLTILRNSIDVDSDGRMILTIPRAISRDADINDLGFLGVNSGTVNYR